MAVEISNVTVDVDKDGCLTLVSGSAIDIFDRSLQHRRHIRLPFVIGENATSVFDVNGGDVYVYGTHTVLVHVDLGRRFQY